MTRKDAKGLTKSAKMKRFVVTCIDRGDSCDGKPRFLGAFKTLRGAESFVEKDIEGYERQGQDVNYDEMSAESCEWNIEEVEIK